MILAFMGTPDFAIPTLGRLIESRHEIALVVTQPSKPKGRGRKIADPPVKLLADESGLRVIQPASLKREPIDDLIRELRIDVIVVVAYGKLLPAALLAAPRLGCLNVHASLLPEYRGAAPIQRALMEGRLETGVTIMQVALELDAGPIVAQQRVEIHEDDDALSLANMLSVLGADLLLRVLDEVERVGRIEGTPQDEALVTYAPPLKKSEGQIDWRLDSEAIVFRLRGLTPWPGLFAGVGGGRARIVRAEPLDRAQIDGLDLDLLRPPGSVGAVLPDRGFAVRTGDGYLLVTRLQPDGKSEMSAAEFMRGRRLAVGRPLDEAPSSKR
jgi:methionyl-tRNA formyltransferase